MNLSCNLIHTVLTKERPRDEYTILQNFLIFQARQDVPSWLEQAAEDAVGSGYGPKGGRFSSRDHREVSLCVC